MHAIAFFDHREREKERRTVTPIHECHQIQERKQWHEAVVDFLEDGALLLGREVDGWVCGAILNCREGGIVLAIATLNLARDCLDMALFVLEAGLCCLFRHVGLVAEQAAVD